MLCTAIYSNKRSVVSGVLKKNMMMVWPAGRPWAGWMVYIQFPVRCAAIYCIYTPAQRGLRSRWMDGDAARSEDTGSRPTDLQDDDDEIEEERMTTSEAEELLRQADSEAENAFF